MKFHLKIKLSLLLLLLIGCGPIYSTKYNYQPPNNLDGKKCIFQCENYRLQCEQTEDMREESCRFRAEQLCYDREGNDRTNCDKPSCYSNYSRCERMYKSCYQACGGVITPHRECVLGCN